MRYEVQAYEPPRRLLLVARTTFFTSVDEIRVEATGSGCTVTYDAKLTLNGPLGLLDDALTLRLAASAALPADAEARLSLQ